MSSQTITAGARLLCGSVMWVALVAGCAAVPGGPTPPRPSAAPATSTSATASTSTPPTASEVTPPPAQPDPDCAKLKCIALTYDDGPSRLTSRLLDTLEGANVTATLFMVGKAATANPGIVRRADAMGIEIGNHTTNHKQLNQQSDKVVRFEIGDTQKRLKAITGRSPTWFRPPYAGRSKRTDAIAGGYRLGVVTWTTSPLDWENTNARTITRLVLDGARRNSIVLMHDTHAWTVDAAPAIIKGLKAKGYTLVTLTQLEGRPKPGKLYY